MRTRDRSRTCNLLVLSQAPLPVGLLGRGAGDADRTRYLLRTKQAHYLQCFTGPVSWLRDSNPLTPSYKDGAGPDLPNQRVLPRMRPVALALISTAQAATVLRQVFLPPRERGRM
jgi:hypothetical protein